MTIYPFLPIALALGMTAASTWSAYALREDMVKKPFLNLFVLVTAAVGLFGFLWFDKHTAPLMWAAYIVLIGLSLGPFIADIMHIYSNPELLPLMKRGVIIAVVSIALGPTIIAATGWTIPNGDTVETTLIFGYLFLLITRWIVPPLRRAMGNPYTLVAIGLFFVTYLTCDFSAMLALYETPTTMHAIGSIASNLFVDAGLCAMGFIAWGRKMPERQQTTPPANTGMGKGK